MGLFESQTETRARLDSELLDRSYAELAASVSNPREAPSFRPSDLEMADGAVRTCLRYCGVEAGSIPDSISDPDARLEWLCRPSGTMHREVHLEGPWYKDAFGAMMGTLDTGERVALLPHTLGGYCYHEPGSGRKRRVDQASAKHIQPEAILFYRPLPQGELGIRSLLVFLFRVFDRSDYLYVLAAALATTLVGLLPAWVNQLVFGTVVPSGQVGLVAPIGALLAGVALSRIALNSCRGMVMARVSTKLRVVAEAAVFSRVLMLPASFFKQYESGNLASRVSQVTSLMQLLTSLLLGAGLTAILSIAYMGQIAAFAPELAFPAVIIIIVQATLTVVATLLSSRRQRRVMESQAGLSGLVTALLGGIQKIKLAGAEDRAFSKWAHGYSPYARVAYNQSIIELALPTLVTLVAAVGTIAIYYFAGTSAVSVADYLAFNVAYGQVSGAVSTLASMAGQVAQIGALLETVSPILKTLPEASDDRMCVEQLSGAIEVSGVSFRYDDRSPYVLQDLSFKVRPGEYVALVGKSGCGKSTILRLLLGFEEAERGTITYGPYDVRKVDPRSLRQHIGTVMQDGRLFMGDIRSNITIAAPEATLDDAWEAAELAGIADDIRRMPMGMQTLVTEGSGGISGGQRQRIMIARAVCGNRRILMFDEATSALDNITQKHVSDSLEKLRCTRVVVAHRLSTVRHCDRILVVDGGRIVEEGSYEELIDRGGIFAELVARQRLE